MTQLGEQLVISYAGLTRTIFMWTTPFGLLGKWPRFIRISASTSATVFGLMKNLKPGRPLPPVAWDSAGMRSSMGLITFNNHQLSIREKPGRKLMGSTAISGSGWIGIY